MTLAQVPGLDSLNPSNLAQRAVEALFGWFLDQFKLPAVERLGDILQRVADSPLPDISSELFTGNYPTMYALGVGLAFLTSAIVLLRNMNDRDRLPSLREAFFSMETLIVGGLVPPLYIMAQALAAEFVEWVALDAEESLRLAEALDEVEGGLIENFLFSVFAYISTLTLSFSLWVVLYMGYVAVLLFIVAYAFRVVSGTGGFFYSVLVAAMKSSLYSLPFVMLLLRIGLELMISVEDSAGRLFIGLGMLLVAGILPFFLFGLYIARDVNVRGEVDANTKGGGAGQAVKLAGLVKAGGVAAAGIFAVEALQRRSERQGSQSGRSKIVQAGLEKAAASRVEKHPVLGATLTGARTLTSRSRPRQPGGSPPPQPKQGGEGP